MIPGQLQRTAVGRLLFALFFLAVVFNAAGAECRTEATVSAAVNPARFPSDEGAILTITTTGGKPADVRLPAVAGLQFESRGTSTQIQIINGDFSSTTSLSYLVRAKRPGQYSIPPVDVSVDGKTLTTRPIPFEVTPAGAASPDRTPGPGGSPTGKTGKPAFLSVSESKTKGWVGEIIPIRIKAYFRAGIKANLNSQPVLKGNGVVMPQLKQNPQQSEENVDGIPYTVLTWDTSISAVKEGSQSLSVDLDATLLLPRRVDPLPPGFDDQDAFRDEFFKNFFGGFESRPTTLTSKPFTLEAKALPAEHQPQDFSGAIGHFSLSVQAKPAEVGVGEPLTLTMTVAGSGNFDLVQAPHFPEDPRWKTYPPSVEFKQGDNPDQGKKTFEQALVVKDGQVRELPPVSFSFFNPETEQYVTLTSPAIPLTVKAGAQGSTAETPSAPSPAAAAKAEPQGSGIAGLAPLHSPIGSLQKTVRPVFSQAWFIALLGLCTVLLLGSVLLRICRRYLRNNPEILKKKERRELFASSMARIRAAAEGNHHGYPAVCRKVIQEMLGLLWQIEPSTITLADLEKRLKPTSGLITVFAEAERGAYANASLSQDQIRRYSEIIEKELAELL
jgi:hypothetical protein